MTRLSWGACTHRGHRRRANEDSVLARPPVFVVADGMGGHRRGDVASSIIVDAFSTIGSETPEDADVVRRVLQSAAS
jgi:serine/threonine protein phosphatase PrpC